MIAVEALSYKVVGKHLLNQVSFEVVSGETLAIVGRNGAGKSTLLRAIIGLLNHEGRVLINGVNRSALKPKQIAKLVSYIPQSLGEFPGFTVSEFVALGYYPRANLFNRKAFPKDELNATLELAGVARFRDQMFDSLSGGEKQKVMLAAALAQNSGCLLLDEPAAHLDPHQQQELFSIIDKIRVSKELTLIIVTHDLNRMIAFADKVLALKDGAKCFCGSVADFCDTDVLTQVYGVPFRFVKDEVSSKELLFPMEVL